MYITVLILEFFFGGFTIFTLFRHIFLFQANKHYWTIPVEMTFYFIAPFLAMFLVKILKKNITYIISFLLTLLFLYGITYENISQIFRTGGTNEPVFILYATPFIFGTLLFYG